MMGKAVIAVLLWACCAGWFGVGIFVGYHMLLPSNLESDLSASLLRR
jgi:purine-cytosine permease-like protein